MLSARGRGSSPLRFRGGVAAEALGEHFYFRPFSLLFVVLFHTSYPLVHRSFFYFLSRYFFFFFSPDHFSSPLLFFLPFFENPSRRHFLRRDISFLGKPRSEGGFQGILRRRLPWGLGRASWEREERRSPRRGVPAGVQEVHLAIRRTERGGSGREPRMSLHKGRSYVTAGEWLLGQ